MALIAINSDTNYTVQLGLALLVIGLAGTAHLVRTMRATLLDELRKPYVQTARAKGVEEWELLRTYPVRVALVPIVATIGWALPAIFSGATRFCRSKPAIIDSAITPQPIKLR